MLRASAMFFILGLLAIFLGAGNFGGVSLSLGRDLSNVFMILAAVGLVFSMVDFGAKSRSFLDESNREVIEACEL